MCSIELADKSLSMQYAPIMGSWEKYSFKVGHSFKVSLSSIFESSGRVSYTPASSDHPHSCCSPGPSLAGSPE